MENISARFLSLSNALLDVAHSLVVSENLSPPTQENSFENARKNLRLLRNLRELNLDMEEWLRLDNLPEQLAKASALSDLILFYAGQVKLASLNNPERLNHYTIDGANFSVGSLALSVALHTLEILPDAHPALDALDARLENIPEAWDYRQAQSVERLLDDLESGITHLLNQPIGDRSAIDALLEISEKIQQTARELYSIETLEEPAREESIELAREILRRLKNMVFSDRPIEDAVDTGRPNEKLAFARKIAEMVDMYKNLLAQAAISSPAIMNDPRVIRANGAVGDCADGVVQMVLKELPKNMANSLEKKQSFVMQEKNVKRDQSEKRTTANIMKSMEGGVESAAGEINKKNETTQRAEQEQARNRIEAARMVRRRLRREKMNADMAINKAVRQSSTPVPERKQQGVVPVSTQKTQATSKETTQQNTGIAGINLNKDALAAVRQAGSALRSSNREASNLLADNAKLAAMAAQTGGGGGDKRSKPSVSSGSNVAENDKISPDDKSFSQREKEKNDPRNKPRIV